MKVKYKGIITWKVMAALWFVFSVFVYYRWIATASEEYALIRVFSVLALTILIGVYYLSMPLINYVTLSNDKISIHQSSIIIRRRIKLEQLDCCRVSKRDLEFYLKNGRSFAIHLDWCNREQAIALIKKLQSTVNIYDGNSQRNINLKDIDVISK